MNFHLSIVRLQADFPLPDESFRPEADEEEFPSCNMELPMDGLQPEKTCTPPPTLCGNFDLDVDFLNVSIIPATPPRNLPPESKHKLADSSPILSQRPRKTLKRKLTLACSTSTPEGKRSRLDVHCPAVPEASSREMNEIIPVGNPAALLSVTQCVHWLDHSSPVPVNPVPVSPLPSPVIRNPEASRIPFQEVNFDLEVDFFERSPSPPALSLVIEI